MLGALIGTAAKAAVTGAAGLAVIGVLKESNIGGALRTVAVTVTEVGVRGYKLVEAGVEKVVDEATEVFSEAKTRAEEPAAAAAPASAAGTGEPGEPTVPAEADPIVVDLSGTNGDEPKL